MTGRLAARGGLLRTLKGHTGEVNSIALLGGTWERERGMCTRPTAAASGDSDGVIHLWSLASSGAGGQRPKAKLRGHGAAVTSLAAPVISTHTLLALHTHGTTCVELPSDRLVETKGEDAPKGLHPDAASSQRAVRSQWVKAAMCQP